jgi:hypothetical protein
MYDRALVTPVVISAYEENGYYVAHVVGNVFVNISTNNDESGTAFKLSGFNASNPSQNILEIRDNVFLGSPFTGLFGQQSQSTSLTLIIENNKAPFLAPIGYSPALPPPITTVTGSIIRGNNFLIPSYPFSSPGITTLIQANPPVPGTVYQNVNPFEIELHIPVFSVTSGLSGTVTEYKGPTSPPAQVGTMFVSGETSQSRPQIVTLRVPPWWYYEIDVSGATVGQATVFNLG